MAVSWQFLVDLNSDGDFSDSGEDLSGFLLEAVWFIGFRNCYDVLAEPSRAALVLDNRAGTFSPESGTFPVGAYALIKSDDGATVRVMFAGFVDSIKIAGARRQFAEVTLVDFGDELAGHKVVVDGQGVTLDAVIEQALERAPTRQWVIGSGLLIGVTGRNLIGTNTLFGDAITLAAQTGKTVCAYVGDAFGDGRSVREVIAACCLAEQGRFYVARNTNAVFKNRHDAINGSHTSIGAISDFVDYEYVDDPNRVNLVAASGRPRSVGDPETVLWELAEPLKIKPGSARRVAARFEDTTNNPVGALVVIPPLAYTDYTANLNGLAGYSGQTKYMHVDLVEAGQSGAKYDIWHDRPYDVYLQTFQVRGTPLYGNRPFTVEVADREDQSLRGVRRLEVDLALVSDLAEMEDWARFALAVRGHRQYMDWVELDFAANGAGILAHTVHHEITVIEAATGHNAGYLVRAESWRVSAGGAARLRLYLEPDLSESFVVIGADKPDGGKLLCY